MSISTTLCQNRLSWSINEPRTFKTPRRNSDSSLKLATQTEVQHGSVWFMVSPECKKQFLSKNCGKERNKPVLGEPYQIHTTMNLSHNENPAETQSWFTEELYTPLKMLPTHQQFTIWYLMAHISYSTTATKYCNIIWWEKRISLPPFHWRFS